MDRTPLARTAPERPARARVAGPRGTRRRALGRGLLAASVAGLVAASPAGAADRPAPADADADAWPAPGDPWPERLDGPVILVDTGEGGANRAVAPIGVAAAAPGGVGAVPALGAALPDPADGADAGACYAEVVVPASWRLEPVEVVVREASERFELMQAELAPTVREVVVRDAHERLTAVAPVTRVETRTREHRPASSRLVRGGPHGDLPASPAELEALAAAGIEPGSLAVGSCAHEWYEAPERRTERLRVLVREAVERLEVEPARFETVALEVETAPERLRLVEIPAAWRETEREVLVEPRTTTWVPGEGPFQRVDAATGLLMCRVDVPARRVRVPVEVVETPAMLTSVEEPATVETVAAERLASEAREVRRPVPARFDTLELEGPAPSGGGRWTWLPDGVRPLESAHEPTGRSVCRREVPAVTARWERESVEVPGRFERERVPAETVELPAFELVRKAAGEAVAVPARTVRLTRRTHLSDARREWRPVLCRTNVTEGVVRRLQRALDEAGHAPGGIDGRLGPATLGAVERYQRERGQATGGLTLETLESLGVTLDPVGVPDRSIVAPPPDADAVGR